MPMASKATARDYGMTKVRILILGTGGMASQHVKLLRQDERAEIVALATWMQRAPAALPTSTRSRSLSDR